MGKSAPSAPDPYETADAQAAANRTTAITQHQLNMVDQVNPWGSVNYTQNGFNFTPDTGTGSQSYWLDGQGNYHSSLPSGVQTSSAGGMAPRPGGSGPNGLNLPGGSTITPRGGAGGVPAAGGTPDGWQRVQGVLTPRYTQTTTLSPEQQAIFDQTQGAQGNLASIANNQSNFLRGYLQEGVDLSGLPALRSGFGDGYNTNFSGPNGLRTDAGLSSDLGPGYATSYAGADDFSGDRRRYEDALWQRTAGDRANADSDIRTTLANKGIREGSAAWNAEMERMGRQNTDARLATIAAGGQEQQRMVDMARGAAQFGNEALLARGQFQNAANLSGAQFGNDALMRQWQANMAAQQAGNQALAGEAAFSNSARGQGFSEAFAQRNQPLNEIAALLSGSQISNPAQMSSGTPQTSVAGTDLSSLVQQDYANRTNAYQNQMGGLFGLGGSILRAAGSAGGFGALFSDKRLKTDVKRIGETDAGVPIYSYRYVWGGPVQIGVMAQDLETVAPHAVSTHPSGFKMVDYAEVI